MLQEASDEARDSCIDDDVDDDEDEEATVEQERRGKIKDQMQAGWWRVR